MTPAGADRFGPCGHQTVPAGSYLKTPPSHPAGGWWRGPLPDRVYIAVALVRAARRLIDLMSRSVGAALE